EDAFATRAPDATPPSIPRSPAVSADAYATGLPSVGSRSTVASSESGSAPASTGNTGVRFRVLQLHAKGGLGQVWVAHDDELHREVALKEIQNRYADHLESRDRFMREARITGKLEHPGIVPVYGLGHYADGRPFYAMRFIKGDSLKEAIEAFHQ